MRAVGKTHDTGHEPRPAPHKNSYVLNRPGQEPIALDLDDRDSSRYGVLVDYYVRAFRQMEQRIDRGGLTIYLQWNSQDLDDLPRYGPDVVALLLMDEYTRLPR
jgi:hypothetical protein